MDIRRTCHVTSTYIYTHNYHTTNGSLYRMVEAVRLISADVYVYTFINRRNLDIVPAIIVTLTYISTSSAIYIRNNVLIRYSAPIYYGNMHRSGILTRTLCAAHSKYYDIISGSLLFKFYINCTF